MERRTKMMIIASVALSVVMMVVFCVKGTPPLRDLEFGCFCIIFGILHLAAPKVTWVLSFFCRPRKFSSNYTELSRMGMKVWGGALILFGLSIL